MAAQLRRRMALTALARAFRPGTPGLGRRFAAVPRMIRATLRREYDGGARLMMMVALSAYVISPIDVVPEAFFMLLGLVDDAAVATFLAGALLDETERFLNWEESRRRVVAGDVVPPRP